jgi:Zn-dependent protease with chaperone function
VNFFEHQDKARSSTKLLVFLFFCAVVVLIAITTLVVIAAFAFAELQTGRAKSIVEYVETTPELLLGVSAVVISIVALGALFRMNELRGGGKAVAESLGGRLLNLQTRDEQERRLLNVVEEMAIASGVQVPEVYLIDDPAINAFAAGYRPHDAVIGITRGAIQTLDRDELQGVIAHEFSHIFNGDMRLNIRLIGWLYGITVIGLIGYHLLRSMRYSRSRKKGAGATLVIGIALVILGYGGTFFANLIKAAVSRQREFLADASAVQFTRNPDGIGGALKHMALHGAGSRITVVDTREIGHMLFGSSAGLFSLQATHPPLAERIRRIDPRWDGSLAKKAPAPAVEPAAQQQMDRAQIFGSVGMLTGASLAEAQHRLQAMPAELRAAVHSTLGSCMTVFAVLLAVSDGTTRKQHLEYLQKELNSESWAELVRMLGQVTKLERKLYLPLVALALPALRQLSAAQYSVFMKQLQHLIDADANLDLFEWCLFRIVRSALATVDRSSNRLNLENCADATRTVLGVLALPASIDFTVLDKALEQLRHVKPLQKPRLLKEMLQCVRADGAVTVEEGELLRAIGAALDCPVPPLG